jgi:predicted NAD/FAD-dependent oxidoreductase
MSSVVTVIGAGIAGLTCARELGRRGVPCRVLERSAEPGGRCVTGTFAGARVDHGMPLLHAGSREFGRALDALPDEGKVRGWPVRVRGRRLADHASAYRGQRRMARREGVQAFARHLSADLDLRTGVAVERLEDAGAVTRVHAANEPAWEAPFVVVATALPDALSLVGPLVGGWPNASAALAAVAALSWVPALTVIAGYPPGAPEPGFDLWHPLETTVLRTLIDESTKRDVGEGRVLVLHAREGFAREHLDDADDAWAELMLWEAAEVLGEWAARPSWRHTHRWPCARLRDGESLGEVVSFESPGGACVSLCGEAFADVPGAEGAFLSGMALAEQIATLPRVREQLARGASAAP